MEKLQKLTIPAFYKMAFPTIIASLTIPLMGIADIAVIGNLKDASLIAGVTVGTQIFDTIYWVFGNIRFIASGQSSQAMGTGDSKQRLNALLQPLALITILCLFIVVFNKQIFNVFMYVIRPETLVLEAIHTYFRILIFACFFVLGEYIMRAWLFGQGKTILCMVIQIVAAALNIILNIYFVYVLHMGIAGVARSTFLVQSSSFLIEAIYLFIYAKFKYSDLDWKLLGNRKNILEYLKMSKDVMLRTIFHTIEKNGFTAFSSRFGTTILAANGILNQTIALMVYPLDALGNTESIYAGMFLGRKEKEEFHNSWKISIKAAVIMAVAESLLFGFLALPLFHLYTNVPEVLGKLGIYRFWMFIFPLAAFLMDIFTGFYSGCTFVRPLRNSAFISMVLFFGVAAVCIPVFGNNGLWIAQCMYWLSNAFILILAYKPMRKKLNML